MCKNKTADEGNKFFLFREVNLRKLFALVAVK